MAIRRLKTPERNSPQTLGWRYDCGDDEEGSQEDGGKKDREDFREEVRPQEGCQEKGASQVRRDGLSLWLVEVAARQLRLCRQHAIDSDEKEPPGIISPAALSFSCLRGQLLPDCSSKRRADRANPDADGASVACSSVIQRRRVAQRPLDLRAPPAIDATLPHPTRAIRLRLAARAGTARGRLC